MKTKISANYFPALVFLGSYG